MEFHLAVDTASPPVVKLAVEGPYEAVLVARAVIGRDIAESVLAIFLNARGRVSGYSEIARGTLNTARFTPRDVLLPALLANAEQIVVAHCHPSGDPTPSSADRRMTQVLRDAAKLMGVEIADHVIVTASSYCSMREHDRWDSEGDSGTTSIPPGTKSPDTELAETG
jgi:DNA repair protein RadC